MQLEFAFTNSITVATNEGRKIGFRAADDILYIVMSLYDIGLYTISIRNHNCNQCTTIIGNSHHVATIIFQEV